MKILTNGDDPLNVGDHLGGYYGIGITKREYFAALALQGYCATVQSVKPDNALEMPHNLASWSVLCADELIKALNE